MSALLLLLSLLSPTALSAEGEPASAGLATRENRKEIAPTVIFIHGLYLNARSWQPWVERFEAEGWEVLAPDWPGHAGEPAKLRESPPAELRELDLADVTEFYRKLVKAQPTPPVLVGHSMGGLIVQILLSEGLGRGGVALHSAPPKGLMSMKLSFLRSNTASLSLRKKPVLMSPKKFNYAFTNDLTRAQSAPFYNELVVPESRVAAGGPLTKQAKVNFKAKHAPLLMIAGKEDHVIPYKLNRKNAKKWKKEAGDIEFEAMPGRTHLTLAEPGWEAVADRVIQWAGKLPD